jgi:hypothetical protein
VTLAALSCALGVEKPFLPFMSALSRFSVSEKNGLGARSFGAGRFAFAESQMTSQSIVS